MPVLSFDNSNRLLWLGRYTERVYSSLKYFAQKFDKMIDSIHESRKDFANDYCFDENSPDSVYSSLMRAYDNAIELREELGSDTFSYIQMSIYEMNKAKNSPAPLLELQKVIDNIAAFWGMADDSIFDEHARNIMKLGKRLERVDIYARFNADIHDIRREVKRLSHRAHTSGMDYDAKALSRLNNLVDDDVVDYNEIIHEAEKILV